MRPTINEYFIKLTKLVSSRSTCIRRSVGCVLVNNKNHILATGYNGGAAGQPHCNAITGFNFVNGIIIWKTKQLAGQETGREDVFGNTCVGANSESGTDLHMCKAIHAEQNALLQYRNINEIETAYCSTKPCIMCIKLLLNTSCKVIIYEEDYPHASQDEWLEAGRTIFQYNKGD